MTTSDSDQAADDPVEEPTQPDEAMLAPVPEQLRDWPVEVVGTPPAPYETALPFHLVAPEDFERVCLVVIERIDGVREARLYGTRGQKDHGIDLVAWDDDGSVVVYQVKRLQRFTADDLEDAVVEYAKPRQRAFRPKRLVVCAARPVEETDRREITDTLARLRNQHDFEIDLYDGRQLTRRLEGHPDVIRRFFGDGWVEAIARGTGRIPSEPTRPDLLAQAALRGPLRALDVHTRLAEADREGTADGDAAVIVGEVAKQLEDKGFRSVAEGLRIRQALLLERAGQTVQAAEMLSALAWRDVSVGRLFDADAAERELRDLKLDTAGAGWQQLRQVFDRVSQWYTAASDDLRPIFEGAKELEDLGNPMADDILLWACESAVAVRDDESLRSAETLIDSAVSRRTGAFGADDETAIRLRCCMADLTGDWTYLDERARGGELGHRLGALVFARRARFAALARKRTDAVLYYRQALDQACQAECFGDAAKLALSWVRVEIDYGFSQETFERQELVEALREAGSATVLPTTESRRWGKDAHAAGRIPLALAHLRQFLREAVVGGRFMAEREAEDLLGEALVDFGQLELGIRHLIRAGRHKAVEEHLQTESVWIDLIQPMELGPPWERGTAFTTVVPLAEYLPDDAIPAIGDLSLNATQDFDQSHFAPLVWLEAWRSVAAIAERLDNDQAARALNLLEPLIDREPNHYHHNDDQHLAVVISLYRAHNDLRHRCAAHLARLLKQDSLAPQVAREIVHNFTSSDQELVAELGQLADTKHKTAIEILMQLGVDHPSVRRIAADRVASEVEGRPPALGQQSVRAALPEVGLLARLVDIPQREAFAHRMISAIEDVNEPETSRTRASHALVNVGEALEPALQDELFERMLVIAAGTMEKSAQEQSPNIPSGDSVGASRVTVRWFTLQPAAARAAGRLARTPAQHTRAALVITQLLERLPDHLANDVGHALHALPSEVQGLDLRKLAESPSPWRRHLAAAAWAKRPATSPALGEALAADPDVRVRRTLAEGLPTLADLNLDDAERLRVRLLRDPAWSVRNRAGAPLEGEGRSTQLHDEPF